MMTYLWVPDPGWPANALFSELPQIQARPSTPPVAGGEGGRPDLVFSGPGTASTQEGCVQLLPFEHAHTAAAPSAVGTLLPGPLGQRAMGTAADEAFELTHYSASEQLSLELNDPSTRGTAMATEPDTGEAACDGIAEVSEAPESGAGGLVTVGMETRPSDSRPSPKGRHSDSNDPAALTPSQLHPSPRTSANTATTTSRPLHTLSTSTGPHTTATQPAATGLTGAVPCAKLRRPPRCQDSFSLRTLLCAATYSVLNNPDLSRTANATTATTSNTELGGGVQPGGAHSAATAVPPPLPVLNPGPGPYHVPPTLGSSSLPGLQPLLLPASSPPVAIPVTSSVTGFAYPGQPGQAGGEARCPPDIPPTPTFAPAHPHPYGGAVSHDGGHPIASARPRQHMGVGGAVSPSTLARDTLFAGAVVPGSDPTLAATFHSQLAPQRCSGSSLVAAPGATGTSPSQPLPTSLIRLLHFVASGTSPSSTTVPGIVAALEATSGGSHFLLNTSSTLVGSSLNQGSGSAGWELRSQPIPLHAAQGRAAAGSAGTGRHTSAHVPPSLPPHMHHPVRGPASESTIS